MTTPAPFDTVDARLLAIVASQTPTAGHALDRAALITTILDACTEIERLRTSLAEAEHNVRALRAECARLGAAACDAKWDLMP